MLNDNVPEPRNNAFSPSQWTTKRQERNHKPNPPPLNIGFLYIIQKPVKDNTINRVFKHFINIHCALH